MSLEIVPPSPAETVAPPAVIEETIYPPHSTASAVAEDWLKRTYKREVALLLIVFWIVITSKLFFWSSESLINALMTVYGTSTTMIGMFAAAAFGFDAYIKQFVPCQESLDKGK